MFRKTGLAAVCISLLCGCGAQNASFSVIDETESREYTEAQDFEQTEEYETWRAAHDEAAVQASSAASRQLFFAKETAVQFLNSRENQNTVYAPLNAWFALAALSACTNGETKTELLDLLNAESEEQLLNDFEALWRSANIDLPLTKEQNALSLWLSSRHSFSKEKLQTLMEQYHLSSFGRKPGSIDMKEAFKNWINDHAKGLLKDDISVLQPEKGSMMSLVSAVDYKAAFEDAFDPKETEIQVFHGLSSEPAVFLMRTEGVEKYYHGSNFGAARKKLKDNGYLYLILPDQGLDLKDIYEQDEMWLMLEGGTFDEHGKDAVVYIDLPVFDVSVHDDLSDLLTTLGVSAAFNTAEADFSEITDENGISLSKAEQAAVLSVDENGICSAAGSQKEENVSGGYMVNDRQFLEATRPFIFAVSGDDGAVRFIGTVYELADVDRAWNGQFPGTVEGVDADHTAVLPQGTVHYYLPEGMESEITEDGELNVYLIDAPERRVNLAFDKDLGLCGTGLLEETRKVNGRYVTLESMSAQSWQYAFFDGKDQEPELVLISSMGFQYSDLADQILHSIHIEN